MIVVLIGYMASGKSTIGIILAKKLGYNFIDLDEYIEEKEKLKVKDIFTLKGEIYFRKKEAQYLNEILNEENRIVLSLGGGTPCYGNNLDHILNQTGVISIYLKAQIHTLVNRLKNEKSKRPLLAELENGDAVTEYIGKHLFERSHFYNQANITISTDNKAQNEIVEELVLALF
ncbi:shikimate kinase [Changchengzhania lutea]|uniref:shikimate kinase n=1 Tax=Changchengzhania lutea TaxID=2049305 RepID=UPI00115EE867|nr:shikimate kinase [Changchengzhania lutea]